jgi:ABC-type branched-subunit amino acid transport system ATPase component
MTVADNGHTMEALVVTLRFSGVIVIEDITINVGKSQILAIIRKIVPARIESG